MPLRALLMNRKLKWLLCTALAGLAVAFFLLFAGHFRHPTHGVPPLAGLPSGGTSSASPLPTPSPQLQRRTTLSRFSTSASPAQARTDSLSRFPESHVLDSQEMFDLKTGERIVVEILQIQAKHPFIRVETRFPSQGRAPRVRLGKPHIIECVADQILVSAKSSATDIMLEKALRDIDARILQRTDPGGTSSASPLYLVGLPTHSPNTVPDALDALARSSLVAYAEPHFVRHAQVTPNDPLVADQYALNAIHMAQAWDLQKGNGSVVVALLDTGVDFNHPDLQGRFWRNPGEIAGNFTDDDANGYLDDWKGMNFAYENTNPSDDNGHGTHVAGIIAAVPDNNSGIAGLCWNVRIMPVKIMDNHGLLYTYDEVRGLDYARNEGAAIVNLSLGGSSSIQSELDAISRLQTQGILVTASAGNDGANNDAGTDVNYPSSYGLANIIAVGFSDSSDQIDPYSNYGASSVDLFAPGTDILSTSWGGGYGYKSGSSFSAPHVAGVAALLKAQNPTWNYVQIRPALLNYVDPLPGMAGKCVSGGRLNAYESLIPRTTLATATESGALVWTTGGSRKWTGQFLMSHDGVDAAASGHIVDNQVSWLQTSVTGPGRLTFWWKVSCEPGFGSRSDIYLQFRIDGQEQVWIDGETDWQFQSYDLTNGTHTLQWRYVKNAYTSAGQDRGWVDQVHYRDDTGPPLLQITSSSATDVTNSPIQIYGTASDDFGVQLVEYRFETFGEHPWQNVAQNPDWSTWYLTTGLDFGTNIIRIRAWDIFGRTSSITRTYVLLTPLFVGTDGCGTVSSNYAGWTYQAPGRVLNIKAKPCPNYLFTHWHYAVSGVDGSLYLPSLAITMSEGLQLTAYFATNQFPSLQGRFNGLFYETTEVAPQSSGFLKLSLADTGTFSGTITCDGQTNAFNGTFDPDTLQSSLVVSRLGKSTLNVSLQLDGTGQITGTVATDSWQAALLADR